MKEQLLCNAFSASFSIAMGSKRIHFIPVESSSKYSISTFLSHTTPNISFNRQIPLYLTQYKRWNFLRQVGLTNNCVALPLCSSNPLSLCVTFNDMDYFYNRVTFFKLSIPFCHCRSTKNNQNKFSGIGYPVQMKSIY